MARLLLLLSPAGITGPGPDALARCDAAGTPEPCASARPSRSVAARSGMARIFLPGVRADPVHRHRGHLRARDGGLPAAGGRCRAPAPPPAPPRPPGRPRKPPPWVTPPHAPALH